MLSADSPASQLNNSIGAAGAESFAVVVVRLFIGTRLVALHSALIKAHEEAD